VRRRYRPSYATPTTAGSAALVAWLRADPTRSLYTLAAATSIARSTLSAFIAGARSPRLHQALALRDACGIDPADWLRPI
jgi:plasmid maintenance system antidote protein VapI